MGWQSRCVPLICRVCTDITHLQVNQDEEQLLFIKTASHRKEVTWRELSAFMQLNRWCQEVSALITANHPYDTPEIIFLPIESGSDPYLQWLRSVVANPPQ